MRILNVICITYPILQTFILYKDLYADFIVPSKFQSDRKRIKQLNKFSEITFPKLKCIHFHFDEQYLSVCITMY